VKPYVALDDVYPMWVERLDGTKFVTPPLTLDQRVDFVRHTLIHDREDHEIPTEDLELALMEILL
jgi:hypothetical protein